MTQPASISSSSTCALSTGRLILACAFHFETVRQKRTV